MQNKEIKDRGIDCIARYLEEVRKVVSEYENYIVVFRGEDEVFSNPCIPSIFRKNLIIQSPYYEKNLLDAMKQNALSQEESYLNNAINAQHGEFPSRLLDVTYNCLVALYFATTPYYHKSEDDHDDKDGMVYVFHFDSAYSPSAQNIQDNYKSIICREDNYLSNNMLFSKSHKFIDHSKINKRIIAQQGAFILFQGDDAESLPKYCFCGIRIPNESKKKLRKELKILFGIHTGYIYPEIVNLVNDISSKCKRIKTDVYSVSIELSSIENQFEIECEYYYKKIIEADKSDHQVERVRITEKVIYSYYLGIMQLIDYCKHVEEKGEKGEQYNQIKKAINNFINEYNGVIDEFDEALRNKKLNELLDVKKFAVSPVEGGEINND